MDMYYYGALIVNFVPSMNSPLIVNMVNVMFTMHLNMILCQYFMLSSEHEIVKPSWFTLINKNIVCLNRCSYSKHGANVQNLGNLVLF